MSFLEMNLGADVKEAEIAPEGNYDLIIDKAEIKDNSDTTGKVNVQVQLLFDGMPEYNRIFHYLSMPTQEDDDAKRQIKQLMVKRFLRHFKIPFDENGFDVEALAGAYANTNVTVEEYTNDAGQSRLSNRLNLPPLPQEE